MLFATLSISSAKDLCDTNTLSEETDLLTPALVTLPEACKNFTVTAGNLDNASAILFGEDHNDRLETMQCMLAMMQQINTNKWSVLFEENTIQSKEQVLKKAASFRKPGKYISADGELFEAICTQASECGTWDGIASRVSVEKQVELSMAAHVLEIHLLSAMEASKIRQQSFVNTLIFLKKMRDKKINIVSYLDQTLAATKTQVIQKVIDQYAHEKKDIFGIVQSILKAMRAANPACEKAPQGHLATCIKKMMLNGEDNKKRDQNLMRLVKQAQGAERKQHITLFRVGNDHAEAVKKSLSNRSAVVTHNRFAGKRSGR